MSLIVYYVCSDSSIGGKYYSKSSCCRIETWGYHPLSHYFDSNKICSTIKVSRTRDLILLRVEYYYFSILYCTIIII